MENLNYYFGIAKKGKFAIGHFNFATAEQLKALIDAFRALINDIRPTDGQYCLMVGTSEGEAKFFGYKQARAIVDAWKKETGLPIFLNADHHKSFATAKTAIEAGYDSILIDASKQSFEENIRITREVVEYAKKTNNAIAVEGELGYLRGSSKILESVEISPDDFTKPEEAKKFVEETGVDRLAVAIGNLHGIATKQKPKLDFDLLHHIEKIIPTTALVLHGGSGIEDGDFIRAIGTGVTNIHINTEIRLAYHEAVEEEIKNESGKHQTTPYKFFQSSVDAMQKVAKKRLKLFMRID